MPKDSGTGRIATHLSWRTMLLQIFSRLLLKCFAFNLNLITILGFWIIFNFGENEKEKRSNMWSNMLTRVKTSVGNDFYKESNMSEFFKLLIWLLLSNLSLQVYLEYLFWVSVKVHWSKIDLGLINLLILHVFDVELSCRTLITGKV